MKISPMREILITGGAGFIGSNLVTELLKSPKLNITVVDNLDPFYDPIIKKMHVKEHKKKSNYRFIKADIRNLEHIKSKLFSNYHTIIHLAAKVGVRPSINDPFTYTQVNVNGTQNMLELARILKCKKFILASSSSIYGINSRVPWKEDDYNLLPISPYAATKVSAELLGYTYAYLYNFQFISLRFFTVYGPGQRPDLAIHKFTKLILEGKPIMIYGEGKTKRDYTYVDDIVSGILSALNYSRTQHEIINLGNNQPVELIKLIFLLEKVLGKKAIIRKLSHQPGDVPLTFADIRKAKKLLGYNPRTDLVSGLEKFVMWFRKMNEE